MNSLKNNKEYLNKYLYKITDVITIYANNLNSNDIFFFIIKQIKLFYISRCRSPPPFNFKIWNWMEEE